MADSKLWFFPDPDGSIEEIDLNEIISDLQFNPAPNQSITEGMTGALAQTQFSSRAMVRIVNERFTDPAIARQLYALETHLKNGGLVAVAVDSDRTWAGFLETPPARGDTSITALGFPFPFGANKLDATDEIEILGPQPYAYREYLATVGAVDNTLTVTLSEAVRFNFEAMAPRWVFARQRGFWPLLRLPAEGRNQPLLTHDHRIAYTFDAQLEEAIDVLDTIGGVPDLGTSTGGTGENESQNSIEAYNTGVLSDTTGNGAAGVGGGIEIPPNLPGLSGLWD